MKEKKVRAHIYVSGLVQGVNFRSGMLKEGLRLEITGYILNLPDGRVEAVAEGDEEDVKQFLNWAAKGPAYAEVTKIKVEWEDYKGEFNNFKIM